MTTEQDIEDIYRRDRKILIIALSILLAIVLVLIYLGFHGRSNNSAQDKVIALTDTMEAHDKQTGILIRQLQMRVVQDSLRYTFIQHQVDRVPDMIAGINKKYDIQRNHITHLTDTESISYFAGWLSKADSL